MKQIQLTQGQVALVDDDDYEWLNKWKWYARQDHRTFYAVRSIWVNKGKVKNELMHRLILGLQSGDKRQCDHRDGNGLNDQRLNLRVCTVTQNRQSSGKRRVATSKYKGVSWYGRDHKWQSHICFDGQLIYLGCFISEIEAARVYDFAALKHHGEFALTNEMLGLLR